MMFAAIILPLFSSALGSIQEHCGVTTQASGICPEPGQLRPPRGCYEGARNLVGHVGTAIPRLQEIIPDIVGLDSRVFHTTLRLIIWQPMGWETWWWEETGRRPSKRSGQGCKFLFHDSHGGRYSRSELFSKSRYLSPWVSKTVFPFLLITLTSSIRISAFSYLCSLDLLYLPESMTEGIIS